MKKFKLKKEARQFFEEKLHTEIEPLDFWLKETISINLLDEGDRVYVSYGKPSSEIASSLKSWGNARGDNIAEFHFTIHVDEISGNDYNKVKIAEVMDEIQRVLNKFPFS